MFPTPWQVLHCPQNSTDVNSHNQPIAGPYQPRIRNVYGWAPKSNIGNQTGGDSPAALSNRGLTDISLLTPDGDWYDSDIVFVPPSGLVDDFDVNDPDADPSTVGDLYQVNGFPENFNNGPFGFQPGYRLMLTRVLDE